MGNGLSIWSLRSKIYSFTLVALLLFGCRQKERTPKSSPIDFNPQQLSSGMLVCRAGNGFFSNYFKKYASKEQKYSHIGIISIEKDTLYVYHSEASELTGIGFVKKEKLTSFLRDIRVYDFFEFNYPDTTKHKIVEIVKKYAANKTPFDLDFDSTNDDRLYCTELIATAVNKALDTTQISPSILVNGRRLYALDDIYLDKNVIPITPN